MTHELEQFYCGDDAWNNFVGAFENSWNNCMFKDELICNLNNQKDIAVVIFGINQNTSLNWIKTSISALDGLSPIECTNKKNLINRLRSMLMRM